jgi:hypothetical protein
MKFDKIDTIPKETLERECLRIAETALSMGYITKIVKKDNHIYAVYAQWPSDNDDEPLIYFHPSQCVPTEYEKTEKWPPIKGDNYVDLGNQSSGVDYQIIYDERWLRYIVEYGRWVRIQASEEYGTPIIGLNHPKAKKAFYRWENEFGYTIHDFNGV